MVYERKPKTTQAFRDKEAGVVNAALKRVVEGGTGTAAAIGRPLAGKTGTSENFGNAWFVGYTPQLSTAVWVGRPEGDTPMRGVRGVNVTGGSFPARIFSQYMKAALAGVPAADLYTASVDDLGLKSSATPAPAPAPSTTVESTTTTTMPVITIAPFPTAPPTTLPRATVPVPTTARPTTTVPRPTTTTSVPPTTTTTATTVRVT